MKKEYLKPAITVVCVAPQRAMLNTSIKSVGNNADLNYGGGNNQAARVKGQDSYNVWDDDWSE